MRKQVYNPFLPLNEYVPDGEPHVFGDRVFLFGSHDKENGATFCMLDYVGWSAPVDDLTAWKCAGVIYSAKQDPLYDEEKMPHMYAPDVVRGNDGRYYLYYCMSGYAGRGGYHNPVSVAVCNTPNGKYEYYGVVQNPDGTPMKKYVCFDPAVINDNGTIRLYYGTWHPLDERRNIFSNYFINRAQSTMYGRTIKEVKKAMQENDGLVGAIHVILADDMLTVTSEPCRILPHHVQGTKYEAHPFFEGNSIRKIDDTYYFVNSSTLNHELCYATSKYPDRGFKFRGVIISNGDIGYKGRAAKDRLNHTGTNHGSIECIGGQWYVFYHRITHHSDYSRQACAEKIAIEPDGTIEMVEVTSCGLNNGPLAGSGTYPAPICCNLTNGKMNHGGNKKKEPLTPCITSGNNERYIKNISNQTLIGYKYFLLSDRLQLTLKMRGYGAGIVKIQTAIDGDVVGEISVEAKESWTEFSGELHLRAGVYPLYFYYIGAGMLELSEFILGEISA